MQNGLRHIAAALLFPIGIGGCNLPVSRYNDSNTNDKDVTLHGCLQL